METPAQYRLPEYDTGMGRQVVPWKARPKHQQLEQEYSKLDAMDH